MLPEWLKPESDRLSELADADQLPHALLIHGPVGTGRRLLALSLIARVLGIEAEWVAAVIGDELLIDAELCPQHPDFSLVQRAPDKRSVSIDQIRELVGCLNLTSHQCGYKAALINQAQEMNANAANSLLKTLEEPPGQSLLVLVTDSLSRLSPTIVSRCQRIRIATPSTAAALAWLKGHSASTDWQPMLELTGGAPIAALRYQRADVAQQVIEFERDVEALRQQRASPPAVARRWVKADQGLCLNWLYQRISAEIRQSQIATDGKSMPNTGNSRLQKSQEALNIERWFADLTYIGELKRLKGSGLNTELQLSGILTRWYGSAVTGGH